MTLPVRLSRILAVLMTAQSALGLLLPTEYRDVAWIRATWFGNDAVTLFVAIPLLVAALARLSGTSARPRLLWLGLLGYGVYNYAFYMLGAELNIFFPIYVGAFVVAAVALVLALVETDVSATAAAFSARVPARLVGAYLLAVALGLSAIWIGMWGAYAFAGRPTPVEPNAFRLIAALDLSLMVPALTAGGTLLWQRRPWGFVIAAVAAVQASLYLLVLTVNSTIAIARGLAQAPGELLVWGPLFVTTAAVCGALLARARAS